MKSQTKINFMVDIETADNKSNAAILSIGIIPFDNQFNIIDDKFYEVIDLESSIKAGLKVGGHTFYWWLQQSKEAQLALLGTPKINDRGEIYYTRKKLGEVLQLLTKYIQSYQVNTLWGNSNRFDFGILENSYHAIGKQVPWKFTLEQDVRTIVRFNKSIKKNALNDAEFITHHPINDCIIQIEYLKQTFKYIATSHNNPFIQ